MNPQITNETLVFDDCSGTFDVIAVGDGRFKILDPSIGLLMEDFACGDIVEATRDGDNKLVVNSRVKKGRYKTFDFLMERGWNENQKIASVVEKIKKHGGYTAGLFGGMFLIALPETCEYDPTADIIEATKSLK